MRWVRTVVRAMEGEGVGRGSPPLFAAADAREASFSPEGIEPDVSLRLLSDGREVVEDYRALQLSLRAHPLAFLRTDLTRRGIVRCADLAHIKDGRHVEVAGIILVRQKPGSAKGVLFITIEDETGIGNGILRPDRFEAQRRTVMSAAMVGMRGRVQSEGLVTHVICDRIIDYGNLLAQVGQMDFPHATERGDGARHAGSPDRGDAGWRPGPATVTGRPMPMAWTPNRSCGSNPATSIDRSCHVISGSLSNCRCISCVPRSLDQAKARSIQLRYAWPCVA